MCSRHDHPPYPELCGALWPATGHPCEHALGHGGHHDRIIAGTWVRWCDYPLTCEDASCDIGMPAARRDASIRAIDAEQAAIAEIRANGYTYDQALMILDHDDGSHEGDNEPEPGCPRCDDLMEN